MTHPEARFCDSDSLMTTHPPAPDILPPTVFYDSAALSGLQVCFKTLMAIHLLGHTDVTNNLILNQSGYMTMLETARHMINQFKLSVYLEDSEAVHPYASQGTVINQKMDCSVFSVLSAFTHPEYRL